MRSLRFRVPALFLLGMLLAGVVTSVIAVRLFQDYAVDQTVNDLRRQAVALGPDHLSCYSLIVEEHTPLWLQVEQGRVTVPDEDATAEMYERCQVLLAEAGYAQYEISNWSRPGKECRHNLVYWRAQPYLGFGPGAHGYFGGRRFWTILSPKKYINAIQAGESALAGAEWIAPDFSIDGFWTYVGATIVVSIVNIVVGWLLDRVRGTEWR